MLLLDHLEVQKSNAVFRNLQVGVVSADWCTVSVAVGLTATELRVPHGTWEASGLITATRLILNSSVTLTLTPGGSESIVVADTAWIDGTVTGDVVRINATSLTLGGGLEVSGRGQAQQSGLGAGATDTTASNHNAATL